ncbi:MAG TPA: hypothetical protein PKE31_14050 [Pseudomonadota bacterium]|nr:hypothetical protein [Pseudomonadota bacterium]
MLSVEKKEGVGVRISWLAADGRSLLGAPGRLGLSACPGRPDLGGTVEDDAAHLAQVGIKVVATLVADRELEFYGVFGLRNALRKAGVRNLCFPIEDAEPPDDLLATRDLCQEILRWLGEGQDVLVHCIGGWGRTGTIASSLLIHEGYTTDRAIEAVRKARSSRCVESLSQARFVARYEQEHKNVRRFYVPMPESSLPDRLGGEPGNRRLKRGSRAPLLFLDEASLRAHLAAANNPCSQVIVSGEALPEQLQSSVDLRLDRFFLCSNGDKKRIPF